MSNFNSRYKPNYSEFFSMIEHISDDLNDRKNRFDKSDLIEMGFGIATGLSWVDRIGYDLQDSENKEKFELKSQKHCLYTKKGFLKKNTSKIKLTNTLQNSDKKRIKASADWLVLVDTGNSNSYSIAIIKYKDVVENYTEEVSDGFTCQIPISELLFLTIPSQITLTEQKSVGYSHEKKTLQMKYVKSFLNNVQV